MPRAVILAAAHVYSCSLTQRVTGETLPVYFTEAATTLLWLTDIMWSPFSSLFMACPIFMLSAFGNIPFYERKCLLIQNMFHLYGPIFRLADNVTYFTCRLSIGIRSRVHNRSTKPCTKPGCECSVWESISCFHWTNMMYAPTLPIKNSPWPSCPAGVGHDHLTHV